MFNQCPICYSETTLVYEMNGQNLCPSCFTIDEFGGEGSGNFGHGGRPGQVGGSGEGGISKSVSELRNSDGYENEINMLQKMYPKLHVPDNKVMNMRGGWQAEIPTEYNPNYRPDVLANNIVAKNLYRQSAQYIVNGEQDKDENTQALYKNMKESQRFAKENLIDKDGYVTVYRGIGGEKGMHVVKQLRIENKDLELETDVVSSFSISPKSAQRAGNYRGMEGNTVIIRQKIKPEQIFDVPFMSGSFKEEIEIVVMNKEKRLKVNSTDILYSKKPFHDIPRESVDKFDSEVINIDETDEDRDWLHIRTKE